MGARVRSWRFSSERPDGAGHCPTGGPCARRADAPAISDWVAATQVASEPPACKTGQSEPRPRGPSRRPRSCAPPRAGSSRPSSPARHRPRRRKSCPPHWDAGQSRSCASIQGWRRSPAMSGTPQWSSTNCTSGAASISAAARLQLARQHDDVEVSPVPASRRTFSRNSDPCETASSTTCSTGRKPLTVPAARARSRKAASPDPPDGRRRSGRASRLPASPASASH